MPESKGSVVVVKIEYWVRWYKGKANRLKSKLIEVFGHRIIFDSNPILVPQAWLPKPFSILLNGTLVYSKLSPLNGETSADLTDEQFIYLVAEINQRL